MPVQRANSELSALLLPDLMGNAFEYMHEPIGDIGIWNGQFETGPDDRPEGWEIQLTGTQTVARTTGGLAGNYCMVGGNTAVSTGGLLISLRYIPVDETRAYYIGGAFRGSNASASITLGVICYNANKAILGTALPLTAVAPGVAWVRYERRVGAGTATTFTAGTRYVRVIMRLQAGAFANTYTYADDIQFGQLKTSTSALLTLASNYAGNTVTMTNNTVVQVAHANLTLTLTEPGYIWAFANSMLSNDTVRTSAMLCYLTAGGVTVALSYVGEGIANTVIPVTLTGRSSTALAAGVQTVSFTFAVVTAGDVASCYRTYMSAFWVRSA